MSDQYNKQYSKGYPAPEISALDLINGAVERIELYIPKSRCPNSVEREVVKESERINTMKIQYMSDLHLEFGDMEVPEVMGDVLVLAGDIQIGTKAIPWINWCAEKFKHVIYILGNHEYYNYDINTLVDKIYGGDYSHSEYEDTKIYELLSDNVHFLDNDYVDIDGVRFIGSTLWSNITQFAAARMTDFHIIKNGDSIFTAEDAQDEHKEAVKFIHDSTSPDIKNVVVTHHCPSIKCINVRRYPDDSMNTGYYTDILSEFEDKVDTWICGHTHASFDFVEHGIRVVGNCRGYVGVEYNWHFDPAKIVEV